MMNDAQSWAYAVEKLERMVVIQDQAGRVCTIQHMADRLNVSTDMIELLVDDSADLLVTSLHDIIVLRNPVWFTPKSNT